MTTATPGAGHRTPARDLALIAVFAALIAALGQVPALTPFAGLPPITAQTLGVMLAGSVLGGRRGLLAVATFELLMTAGLPLLSPSPTRPSGGLGVWASATAGYLIGWLPGAWAVGRLVELRPARWTPAWLALANVVGGVLVIYAFGVPGVAWRAGVGLGTALLTSLVFLPGDLMKVAASTVITAGVLRGYPQVTPGRRRPVPVPGGRR